MAIRNVAASPELRELISKYLIEQMGPVLRAARPTRREAAVECLGAANFGTASTCGPRGPGSGYGSGSARFLSVQGGGVPGAACQGPAGSIICPSWSCHRDRSTFVSCRVRAPRRDVLNQTRGRKHV
jgi:hypothetical protein